MIKIIDNQIYQDFAMKLNQDHFLNSLEYLDARKKMGWNGEIIGYYEDEELLAVAIVHNKKLPKLNKYFFYIPRGFIIDFQNEALIKKFTSELKAYVKARKGYALRIDPEQLQLINGEENPCVNYLKNAGFKHLGYKNNFEGTHARSTIVNYLNNISYEELYNGYEKNCQKHIKNALDNGIEIVKSDDVKKDLDAFMEIMEDTAKRGGYITRSREYFEIIFASFKDQAELYFAQFNPNNIDLEKKQQEVRDLEKQIKDLYFQIDNNELSKTKAKKAQNQLKQLDQIVMKKRNNLNMIEDICAKYPNGIKLSTAIYIRQHDKAWYWFGGSRTSYRELNPVYAMFDKYLHTLIDNHIKYFDFVGISGNYHDPQDKNYGLYQFKKSFGGDVLDFVGEFDLIINKPIYKIANRILTLAQTSKKNKLLDSILKFVNKN